LESGFGADYSRSDQNTGGRLEGESQRFAEFNGASRRAYAQPLRFKQSRLVTVANRDLAMIVVRPES
jgi:hypothetical protein